MNNQENKDLFEGISDETMIKASELLEEKHRLQQEYNKVTRLLEAEIKKEEGEIVELPPITKECPVCYSELNINNVVNLQCEHALCVSCFGNWVDKGEKNSCPCCRSAILNSSRQKELIEITIDELREEESDVREDIIEYKKRCRSICNLQDRLMKTVNEEKYKISSMRTTKKMLLREVELKHKEFNNVCQSIDIAIDKKKEWDKNPKLGVEYWTKKHNKFKRANEKRLKSFKKNLSCELDGMKKEHDKYYMYKKPNGQLVDFNLKPSHIKNQKLRQKLYGKFATAKNTLDVDLTGCMNMFEEDTTNYETPPSLESRVKWTVDENDENLYLDNLFDVHPLDEYDYDTHWNERTREWGEYDFNGYESSDSDYSSIPELEESDTEAALEFINEFREVRGEHLLSPVDVRFITPRSLTREFNRAARNSVRIGNTNFFLQEYKLKSY